MTRTSPVDADRPGRIEAHGWGYVGPIAHALGGTVGGGVYWAAERDRVRAAAVAPPESIVATEAAAA